MEQPSASPRERLDAAVRAHTRYEVVRDGTDMSLEYPVMARVTVHPEFDSHGLEPSAIRIYLVAELVFPMLFSGSQARRLVKAGHITVNGSAVSYPVALDMFLTIRQMPIIPKDAHPLVPPTAKTRRC